MKLNTGQQAVVHRHLVELQLADQSLQAIVRVSPAAVAAIIGDDVARLTEAVHGLVTVIRHAEADGTGAGS